MIAADGGTVWVHDSSIPIFALDGSLEYFLGFTIDITERRLAEERQRATEQRYRDLVERLPAVTYLQSVVPGTSVAAATTYMSPLIEGMLGYPVERWYSDVGFWRQIVASRRPRTDRVDGGGKRGDRGFVLVRPPADRGRRPGGVGARGGGADPNGRRRPAVLAGVHPRHHGAQAGRGAAAPGGGTLPADRRAHAGDHVPGRPCGAGDVRPVDADVVRQPADRGDHRVPGRAMERARLLARAHPPGRPGAGPSREQRGERQRRAVPPGLPDDRRRRSDRLVPRRVATDPRRRRPAALLAGRDGRHHGSEGSRGAASAGRGALPLDRRADAGDRVPGTPVERRGAQRLRGLRELPDRADPRLRRRMPGSCRVRGSTWSIPTTERGCSRPEPRPRTSGPRTATSIG